MLRRQRAGLLFRQLHRWLFSACRYSTHLSSARPSSLVRNSKILALCSLFFSAVSVTPMADTDSTTHGEQEPAISIGSPGVTTKFILWKIRKSGICVYVVYVQGTVTSWWEDTLKIHCTPLFCTAHETCGLEPHLNLIQYLFFVYFSQVFDCSFCFFQFKIFLINYSNIKKNGERLYWSKTRQATPTPWTPRPPSQWETGQHQRGTSCQVLQTEAGALYQSVQLLCSELVNRSKAFQPVT